MKQAKIKARRKYKDIQLQRKIQKNEVYTVSLERAEEIVKANLCDIVEIFDDNNWGLENIVSLVKEELNDLKVSELKEIAKDKGIKTNGLKKAEIIDKLLNV